MLDRVDGRVRDLDQKFEPKSVDEKTPRIDLDTQSVAQRMELAECNLELGEFEKVENLTPFWFRNFKVSFFFNLGNPGAWKSDQ